MEKKKRKTKYHPSVDFNKSSLIMQEATENLLTVLRKSIYPSVNTLKSLESLWKVTQPSTEILRKLEYLQKSVIPSKEIQEKLEELKKVTQPSTEILRKLEYLQKSVIPSKEIQEKLEELYSANQQVIKILNNLNSLKDLNESYNKLQLAIEQFKKLKNIKENHERKV